MPPSKDDRLPPDSQTRLEHRLAAVPNMVIEDEDSSAVETEIYTAHKVAGVRPAGRDSEDTLVDRVVPEAPTSEPTRVAPAIARARAAVPAAGRAPVIEAPREITAPSRPSLSLTVSIARSPLEEKGFGARYLPLGVLGEGGMGLIADCKDVRIGREVAMKLLRKEVVQKPDARMRFEREARVQGQLEHPAIVPVYDLGVRPDGTPFFTMKRLHGDTLAAIMDALQKGLPTVSAAWSRRKLLTSFSSVCLAVAFANARGVLHRDLKPNNIMLGDFGEVYLLDWGLAKLTVGEDPDARIKPSTAAAGHSETQIGEVMGTPGYMSPEQLRGEIDQLDARTDVYSLGVIFFEMLTLEPLHPRKGLDTIYSSTLGKTDPRVGERALACGLPPELVAICVKATALDPSDRYPSARELQEAVERFLEGNRDLKQREELAAGHAATAREAALLAGKVPEMRELAIREVSAALALDPSHAGAVETLTRLMLEAPAAAMTPEARKEFERARRPADRETRRGTLYSYLLWVCFIPIVLSLGVRDMVAAGVTGGAVVLAAGLSAIAASRRRAGTLRFVIYCLGTLAIGSTCTLLGWAMVVPGLAAVHTVAFIVSGEKRFRGAALVLGVLALLVPFGLQEAGVLPHAYSFEVDKMVVLPRMTSLPPLRSQLYLVLASLAAIVVPALVIWRMRDSAEAAEERAFVQAWTMRTLVPSRAREAAAAVGRGRAESRASIADPETKG